MKLYVGLSLYLTIGSVTAFFSPAKLEASCCRMNPQLPAASKVSTQNSRSDFLKAALATATLLASPQATHAKSYSANARNLDRVNAGDFSGGSVYDNNPSAAGARRRRAMQGCKIPVAREEASEQVGFKSSLSEKDCNTRVMDESPDFMLQAMQTLDCPTCPYGVKASC